MFRFILSFLLFSTAASSMLAQATTIVTQGKVLASGGDQTVLVMHILYEGRLYNCRTAGERIACFKIKADEGVINN